MTKGDADAQKTRHPAAANLFVLYTIGLGLRDGMSNMTRTGCANNITTYTGWAGGEAGCGGESVFGSHRLTSRPASRSRVLSSNTVHCGERGI